MVSGTVNQRRARVALEAMGYWVHTARAVHIKTAWGQWINVGEDAWGCIDHIALPGMRVRDRRVLLVQVGTVNKTSRKKKDVATEMKPLLSRHIHVELWLWTRSERRGHRNEYYYRRSRLTKEGWASLPPITSGWK